MRTTAWIRRQPMINKQDHAKDSDHHQEAAVLAHKPAGAPLTEEFDPDDGRDTNQQITRREKTGSSLLFCIPEAGDQHQDHQDDGAEQLVHTDKSPVQETAAQAFQEEAVKRIRELHMYDVLRADRCISVNSLEARVPFGDLDFVRYVMRLDPEMKVNRYGKGKYLLRHAFEGDGILPDTILWREKAAFSDAVGHSMVDDLKEYAESQYTDEEFEARRKKYSFAAPFTKESLLYRELFEKYYPGQAEMVVDFWMPNRNWEGCNVNDPSARVLSNYGDSGK